jgi:hypothetical protein
MATMMRAATGPRQALRGVAVAVAALLVAAGCGASQPATDSGSESSLPTATANTPAPSTHGPTSSADTPPASPTAGSSVAPTVAPTPVVTARSGTLASGPPQTEGLIAYTLATATGEGRELRLIAPDGTGDQSCGTGSHASWSSRGFAFVYEGPSSPTAGGIEFPDVYRADGDCTRTSLVLREGARPALSPDDASLTFGRGIIDTGDAWIAASDGSNPRLLRSGSAPLWSPDGSWLLVNPSITFEVGIIRPAGTDFRVLAGGGQASWTPDGRIVLVRTDSAAGTSTIRVIALDGSSQDRLTVAGEIGWPRLVAGGRIVFLLDGDLWRLEAGAASPVRLTQGLDAADSPPSPSRDGVWAAVAVGGGAPGLAVVALDGGGWLRIASGQISDPAWEPLGQVE